MRYWDASALGPLVIQEPGMDLARAWLAVAAAWDEVTDVLAVRSCAISLLARHPLRAADAGQLGSALVVAEREPSSLPFVCLDRALAIAGEREGFDVRSWPTP